MSKVFVYTYHRVYQKKSYDIGVSLFEFHLKVFKNFFEVLDWERFKAFLKGEYIPKKRAVFLTFDDGYVDNYIYAYPLLKKYGLKAHLFITPSRVSDSKKVRKTLFDYWKGNVSLGELFQPKSMWEAQKEYFLKGYSEEFLTWEEIYQMRDVFSFGSHGISHSQGFVSKKLTEFVSEQNIDRIYSLWNIYKPPKEGYPIFERRSDLVSPTGKVKKEVLEFCEKFPKKGNWEEKLKEELEKNFPEPLEFESEEQYQKRVENDLKNSKRILEEKLGLEIDNFSYPWGDYSENLVALVGKYYQFAFTVEKKNVKRGENPLKIPRIYAVKDPFTFLKHLIVYAL
ncbi:MAG: polysaccharide deacetylase [Gammaproteobacteria bacterium]|nr:MAG: polysaccharide deacetylase [Gammaproteobacteria bacterium]